MEHSELIDARGLAELLKVSKRSVFRYCSSGRVPRPVKISGALRWRLQEDIRPWIAMGCPSRKEFEARKEGRTLPRTRDRAARMGAHKQRRAESCPLPDHRSSRFSGNRLRDIQEVLGDLLLALQRPTLTPEERAALLFCIDKLLRLFVESKYGRR